MRLPAPVLLLAFLVAPLAAQQRATTAPHLTTPQEALGFTVGADYRLPTYVQLQKWWEKLAKQSPRMKLDTIGTTAEGRPQLMAIISSPANLAKLGRFRAMSDSLAHGRIDSATARRLAQTGKAVVWIDGGLHADEVLGANQLLELVWQFTSMSDPETLRILDDVIILAVQVNPDGMQLVADWYMRNPDTLQRRTGGLPKLYEKYAGHDDNRDWYRAALPETQNGERIQYRSWYPQIIYNHHQTGPAGSVMFTPPFRDPFNYYFDPMIPASIDWVGMAMQRRFSAEGKAGIVDKNSTSYSTWWNGGLRTAGYFHNMIGILTEAIGNPTPETIQLNLTRQLPSGDGIFPVQWGPWHFRQSIDYSMTANRAILDLASRYREDLLFNFWRMGRNSVERGSKDSWTTTPNTILAAEKAGGAAAVVAVGGDAGATPPAVDPAAAAGGRGGAGGGGGRGGGRGNTAAYAAVLRDPMRRDPRAFVIPADQPEFAQALDFLQALSFAGIEIHKATAAFTIKGVTYPKGSFVVRGDQAFRPHVLDMFEPQWHPMDLQYPGGPPKRPYDNAGYTLAYQMGFKFDRILDAFTAPLAPVTAEKITPDASAFEATAKAWKLSPGSNDAFLALNRLFKANQHVERLANGEFVVTATPVSAKIVGDLARERALWVRTASAAETGTPVKALRIGLWDQYGGSMPAGWARWILEHYEMPFERVFAPRLNAGNLQKDFDVLVFMAGIPGNAAGGRGGGGGGGGGGRGGADPGTIPEEYRNQIGRMSVDTTLPQLKAFLEQGGRIVTIGATATTFAADLNLPITNQVAGISNDKYYIPGSILEVTVDTTQPAAAGAHPLTNVFFDNSPVWRLGPDAEAKGIKKIAWFSAAEPLRSGWAIGQDYLKGGVQMVSAQVGQGTAYFYAPEMTFRAQPEGTFKFIFNTFYK